MRFLKAGCAFLIMLSILSGCATSIYVKVVKPAEVNMSGARKLAIFAVNIPSEGAMDSMTDVWKDTVLRIKKGKFRDSNSLRQDLAEYTTDNLISNLLNTKYFEIISPTDVERSIEYYDSNTIDPIMLGQLLGAEAIILSEITDMDLDKERFVVIETYVDEETEEEYEVEVPWIRKTVRLRFTYWVISTVTDRLIATKSFSQSKQHQVKEENSGSLRPTDLMYKDIINGNLAAMAKQLAPYEIWEARVMMNDKTKDPRMKEADNLVKGNIYEKALDLYLEIWYDTQNPAAGVNAAIMHEVLGDVDSALALIEEVINVSAEPKVMNEYKRLKRVKEDLIRLEEQMGKS
ncbi:MAG: hypothetical protein JXJ04_02240 [Spirochaetales bacterium]|nr:hypothetical protein [Spirochaetales bacterium]